MPTPSINETRDQFIQRCIPIVLMDGTAKNPAQAVAVCSYYFDDEQQKNGKANDKQKQIKQ